MKTSIESTLYKIRITNEFKKHLKKIIRQGKDISKLEKVATKLANREELEPQYKNHNLVNSKKYKNCGECHIEPDWLLVYQYNNNELILLLVATGSHSELFRK